MYQRVVIYFLSYLKTQNHQNSPVPIHTYLHIGERRGADTNVRVLNKQLRFSLRELDN